MAGWLTLPSLTCSLGPSTAVLQHQQHDCQSVLQCHHSQRWLCGRPIDCPKWLWRSVPYILAIAGEAKGYLTEIILISPFENVQFAIDNGDQGELKWYIFDHGHNRTFYAPNTMINPENEQEYILWGWIKGGGLFKLWNGCFSIPRILSLSNDNLIVKPSPILEALRTNHRQFTDQPAITNLHDVCGELVLKISGTQKTIIDLYTNTEDKYQILHNPKENTIKMGDEIANLQFPGDETVLHLFIDRSVIELYINYRECFTTRFYPDSYKNLAVDCHGADFESLDVWDIKKITQNM